MQSFKKYISEPPELDEGKGKPGLWANIHAKRKRGERPAKPGEEGYPKTLDIEESGKGYQPGWMLKKDPELAKKLKDKIDLAKKRQASYGNPAAGKSVKENKDEHDINSLQKHFGPAVAYDAASHGPAMMKRKDISGKSHTLIKQSNGKYKSVKEEVEQLDEVKVGDVLIAGGKNITAGIVKKIEGDSVIVHHRPSNTLHRVSKKSISPSNIVKEEVELKQSQGVAESEAPLKHHNARVSYHKEGDPHRRYEAIFKTTHNGGKEETEKRAKAAFAAKKKIVYDIVHEQGVAEELDTLSQIDELSKETLGSYKHKAELSIPKDDREYKNRSKGIDYAEKKLKKESVEQIDELSKSTLGSYVKKANTSAMSAAHAVGSKRSVSDTEPHITKMFKRKAGVEKAADRLTKESVEQLDELSPNLLHRYIKKSSDDMGMHAVDHGKYGDQQKDKKSLNKAIKRSDGIVSASGRLADKANRNESEINDITAQYINENNITLEELENMTEAELNELIGKAIGGAFKLGAKAAVGATRLAGRLAKKTVVNKQGNFRFGAQGKADAEKRALDKEKAKDKAIRDRERFAKERQALKDRQNKERQSNN